MDDMVLLREYATSNSEAAFETLVSRRIGFVYSAALRQVRDPHRAEEVAQAVFIILAQKAGRIPDRTILTGWLFRTTRFTALAQIRAAERRQRHEQEVQMQTELPSTAPDPLWEQLSPLLDEALATLGEQDRQAVLLRFFENKSLAEVGNSLGTGEDTARKRVSRALEKLHRFFGRRGVSLTTAILAGTISANSVHAAPAMLAKTIAAVSVTKGSAAAASTLTLAKGALKLMAWTKIQTAALIGAAILLAGGATTMVLKAVAQSNHEPTIDESLWTGDSRTLQRVPPVLIVRPTRFAGGGVHLDAGDRVMLLNAALGGLLGVAYGFPESRVVLPNGLSQERFDLMLTLPDHPREALQKEIKRKFGLAGHPETREVEVLQLKVDRPDAPGLVPSHGGPGGSTSSSLSSVGNVPPEVAAKFHAMSGGNSGNQTLIKNQTMAELARYLEKRFGRQVLDRTGTTNRFDFKFQVQPRDGESQGDALKRAILEQLGLELAPGREPIEMLVAEHVN